MKLIGIVQHQNENVQFIHPEIMITVSEDDLFSIRNLNKITCSIKNAHLFGLTAYIHKISKVRKKRRIYSLTLRLKNLNYKKIKAGMMCLIQMEYQSEN